MVMMPAGAKAVRDTSDIPASAPVREPADRLPLSEGRILDVGCGSGTFGRKLIDRGFHVDGVIPSAFLAQRVREVFGEQGEVFESRLEDLETDKKYDLVLFSESFQYVDIDAGLAKADALLQQARKNVEIAEKQLQAAEKTAETRLQIAEIRLEKFLGQPVPPAGANGGGDPPPDGEAAPGTNGEVLVRLRELVEEETLDAGSEGRYTRLIERDPAR